MRRKYPAPQIDGLNALFNEGALGKLIADTFGGTRGHTPPRQDAEVVIVFPSEEKMPGVEELAPVVTAFYEGRGYCIEPKIIALQESFEALVYYKGMKEDAIYFHISTHYPFPPHGPATLHLVSNVFAPRSPLPEY